MTTYTLYTRLITPSTGTRSARALCRNQCNSQWELGLVWESTNQVWRAIIVHGWCRIAARCSAGRQIWKRETPTDNHDKINTSVGITLYLSHPNWPRWSFNTMPSSAYPAVTCSTRQISLGCRPAVICCLDQQRGLWRIHCVPHLQNSPVSLSLFL